MKLAQKAEPLGVVVIAECDLKMEGCTAIHPAPVTIVKVGPTQDQFVVCRSCLERMIQEGEWSVLGARIRTEFDFQLVDSLGRPLVTIEVKEMPRTRAVNMERWAASLRRNLAAHAAIPSTPYFILIAVPEVGYLWSNPEAAIDAIPDYKIDLEEFTPVASPPVDNGRAAEDWVEQFLEALLDGRFKPHSRWWQESGLQNLVEAGDLRIVRNVAVKDAH